MDDETLVMAVLDTTSVIVMVGTVGVDDIDAENFKMKVNYCKDILEACNVVMPG